MQIHGTEPPSCVLHPVTSKECPIIHYILVGVSLHAECGCFVESLELKAMALEAVKDSGHRLPKMPRGLEDLGKNNSQGQQDC